MVLRKEFKRKYELVSDIFFFSTVLIGIILQLVLDEYSFTPLPSAISIICIYNLASSVFLAARMNWMPSDVAPRWADAMDGERVILKDHHPRAFKELMALDLMLLLVFGIFAIVGSPN